MQPTMTGATVVHHFCATLEMSIIMLSPIGWTYGIGTGAGQVADNGIRGAGTRCLS
jgi:hypothetical protein